MKDCRLNSEVIITRMADSLLRVLKFQSVNYPDMMASERQVAEFLDELGLPWTFEFPVFVYDERKRPRVWTPDFFIPKLGLYIEVCGSKDFNYKYREKIYRDNSVQIVFLHLYKKQDYWKKFLCAKIREVEETRHSEAITLIENVSAKIPIQFRRRY